MPDAAAVRYLWQQRVRRADDLDEDAVKRGKVRAANVLENRVDEVDERQAALAGRFAEQTPLRSFRSDRESSNGPIIRASHDEELSNNVVHTLMFS